LYKYYIALPQYVLILSRFGLDINLLCHFWAK